MDINDFRGIVTVLFFIAFMVMVVWVFLPSRKRTYEDAAQLPFKDEPTPNEKQKI